MKVSAAALSFLILAATLGLLAHGSLAHESRNDEPRMVTYQLNDALDSPGIHHPADCCYSYTQHRIRCRFMKSYFVTTRGCSQPAVIFTTKSRQRVCANPNNVEVQNCIRILSKIPSSSWQIVD